MKQAAATRSSQLSPSGGTARPQAVEATPERTARALATLERADTQACALPTPIEGLLGDGEERQSGVELISRLGPYRLLKLIGSGAMGNVYEAEHVLLARRVAIKTLRRELAGNRSFEERMFAEARVSDIVGNDHIVKVFDLAHEPNGLTWFAMELLEGDSLAALCDRRTLELGRALDIARQICDALIPVHEAGIIHRDIKPDNVFVVDHGGVDFVKLLDFGIARLPAPPSGTPEAARMPEVVIGTPPYMAPEQVFGGEVDQRSDLYAVGALLYELLTGHVLFERESMTELLGAVVLAQPPVPSEQVELPESVRADLDRVVARCLAKDRVERPESARELADELALIAAHLQGEADTFDAPQIEVVSVEQAAEPAVEQAAEQAAEPAVEQAVEQPIAVQPELVSEQPLRFDPSLEVDLSALEDDELPLPLPRPARQRRAVAWVALTAAAATWLAPASAVVHVQPAVANVGSWVTAVVAGSPWSKLGALAPIESASASDP